MKKNLFLLIFFTQSLLLFSQNKITGFVVSNDKDIGAANVNIRIKNTNYATVSNKIGRFDFLVSDTIKNIKFELNSRFEISKTSKNLKGQYIIQFQKSLLKSSMADLLFITVVTPFIKEQKKQEAPAIIDIITSEEIEKQNYKSLAEIINSVAGIDVLYDNCFYNIGIRGINSGQRANSRIVKILVNQQEISYKLSSAKFIGEEFIPLNAIDRVEILKGPASALYGKDAYLGVINIITKQHKNETKLNIDYEKGATFEKKGWQAIASYQHKKFSYLASLQFSNQIRNGLVPQNVPNSYLYTETDKTENNIYKPISFFVQINKKTLKFGDFNLQSISQSLNASHQFADWTNLNYNNFVSLYNAFIKLSHKIALNEKENINSYISFSTGNPLESNRLNSDLNTKQYITQDEAYRSYNIYSLYNNNFSEKLSFAYGINAAIDHYNLRTNYLHFPNRMPRPIQDTIFDDTTFNNIGLIFKFGYMPLLNKSVLTNFKINTAIRYEINNLYDNHFNYNFSIILPWTKYFITKMLIGTSFKEAAPIQLYSNYITPNGIISNPNLKNQLIETHEFNNILYFLKKYSFEISAYYNKIKNNIELVLPIGNTSNIVPENISHIESVGLETSLSYKSNNNNFNINASFQRSIMETYNITKEKIRIKTPLYPELMIKSTYSLLIPKFYSQLGINMQYIGKRYASNYNNFVYSPSNYRTNRYQLDDYLILNANISSHNLIFWKNLETKITFTIKNVLNTHYAYPGYIGYDIPGQGRIIGFEITQSF